MMKHLWLWDRKILFLIWLKGNQYINQEFILIFREKSKLYGKVNTKKGSDISAIKLPPALTEKNGHSIFLYDSRTARARDKDAVFVFAHPYV